MIFAARRKNHRWDLEALETATRAALHQAGAKLLEQLLEAPWEAEPEQPCHCGRRAPQRGRRPKKMLTVLGEVEIERPYYLCGACHQGQFPFDREIDVADTQYSPGVRRMMALVGSESSFEGGREQLRVWAGLEVTTKAVERGAEAIGSDLAAREQEQIQRALQLPLPQVTGADIPILYIEMDGSGVPLVAAETIGRPGKDGAERAPTREYEVSPHRTKIWLVASPPKRTISKAKPRACAIPAFANKASSSAGVIEAGCQTVIAQRLKQSGMFWTVRGANAIVALRCARLSGRFEDYWENRAQAA